MKKITKEIRKAMEDFEINTKVKLVKVSWEDANTNTSDLSMKEVIEQTLLPIETIGYLLYENDKLLVVCGFWFWDGQTDILDENSQSAFRYTHIIPRSQVKNIIIFKPDFDESRKCRLGHESEPKHLNS